MRFGSLFDAGLLGQVFPDRRPGCVQSPGNFVDRKSLAPEGTNNLWSNIMPRPRSTATAFVVVLAMTSTAHTREVGWIGVISSEVGPIVTVSRVSSAAHRTFHWSAVKCVQPDVHCVVSGIIALPIPVVRATRRRSWATWSSNNSVMLHQPPDNFLRCSNGCCNFCLRHSLVVKPSNRLHHFGGILFRGAGRAIVDSLWHKSDCTQSMPMKKERGLQIGALAGKEVSHASR